MNKQTSAFCVLALFLLSAVLNYAVHFDYPLPIHSDEYDHLAIISEMQRTHAHVWYDPYLVTSRHAQRNLEINYDVFLFLFADLTGLPLEHIPLVLPILFTFMLSLSSFVLVYFLTKRDLAAFFGGVFALFLPNSIAFLGYWFLVPMALGLAALPLMAYAFLRSFRSWAYTLALYLFIVALTLTHAVYTVALLPAFGFFMLLSFREFERRENLLKLALGALVLLGLTSFFVAWKPENLIETALLLLYMLVWAYGKYTPDYPLNEYIGYVLGSLALAGVFYLLLPAFNRRFHSVAARFRVFESVRPSGEAQFFLPLLALTLLAVRLYADIGGVCLLGPCRRTVPALALTALLLAAIGFYSFIAFLNRLLASVSPRPYRILRAAIFLLVLVFLIHQLSTHPFHYARDPVRGLYHNIEFDELPAIAWLKARSKPSEVLFALPWTAKAVYLLADRKVVDTGAARLGAGLHGLQDIVNFFLVDCAAKEATLLRRKSDWIYAGKGYVDCPSLDQVLSSGGNYVYVQNG